LDVADDARGVPEVPDGGSLFASMDRNGNGVLSKAEVKKHLKAAPWAQGYIKAGATQGAGGARPLPYMDV